jgi:hypothetical protein
MSQWEFPVYPSHNVVEIEWWTSSKSADQERLPLSFGKSSSLEPLLDTGQYVCGRGEGRRQADGQV